MSRHTRQKRIQVEEPVISTKMLGENSSFPQDKWKVIIIFLFHILVLIVPLIFTWFNEELFEFNKMILTYAITTVIGMAWIGRMIFYKKIILRKTVFDVPIGLFFVSQCLSTLFSLNIHTSIFGYYSRFHGGLLSTISYIILFYAFVSTFEKKDIKPFLYTTFFSSLLVSFMAIPEHFGHSFSCLLVNTDQNVLDPAKRSSAFSLSQLWSSYNVSCWIQDVQSRVFASFGQPNWLAAYDITLIPVGIALALQKTSRRSQIFFAFSTVLLYLSLLFTKSRSGLIGLGIGLGVFCVFLVLRMAQSKSNQYFSKLFREIAGFFLLFVLLSGIFGTILTPTLSKIFHTHTTKPISPSQPAPTPAPAVNRLETGGSDSGEIRKIVWSGAIKVWRRFPLLGSGVETFAYSYYQDRPQQHNLVSEWDFLYNKAHNEFLNFLATTGLVGLITYCLVIATFISLPVITFWKHSFSDQRDSSALLLFPAFSAGIIALSISNFFGFSTVMVSIVLFLYPAAYFVLKENTFQSYFPLTSIEKEQLSLPQISFFVVEFFIGAGMLFSIWSMWQADHIFNQGKQEVQAQQVSQGVADIEEAVQLSPREPLFYEELGTVYAQLAPTALQSGDATSAAQLAQLSVQSLNKMLTLNPINVNFYKSQARALLYLAQIDPRYLDQAQVALQKATELAPTDPKVLYNLALIESDKNLKEKSQKDLEKVLVLKPDYGAARLTLAQLYEDAGRIEDAKIQYRYILQNIQPDNDAAKQKLKALSK